MINPEDFIKRLEIILDYYGLNASSFADNIGVQRSSLSHLLSGRNKPSLDFILKILEVYPEVDLYWILNGEGTFPKSEATNETEVSPPKTETRAQNQEPKLEKQLDVFEENYLETKQKISEAVAAPEIKSEINTPIVNNSPKQNNSEIDRIVILYKNGTFTTYSPE